MSVEEWPWPANTPGQILLCAQVSCAPGPLFDSLFAPGSDVQVKWNHLRNVTDYVEGAWVTSGEALPTPQFQWLAPPAAAATPLAAGLLRRIRYTNPASVLVRTPFQTEETQKIIVHRAGEAYIVDCAIMTTAPYGDRVVSNLRLVVRRSGSGSSLAVGFAVQFCKPISGLLKPLVHKGAEGGFRASFQVFRKVLEELHSVDTVPVYDNILGVEGPATPVDTVQVVQPVTAVGPAAREQPLLPRGAQVVLVDSRLALLLMRFVAPATGRPSPRAVLLCNATAVLAVLASVQLALLLLQHAASSIKSECTAASGLMSELCVPMLAAVQQLPRNMLQVCFALALVVAASRLLLGLAEVLFATPRVVHQQLRRLRLRIPFMRRAVLLEQTPTSEPAAPSQVPADTPATPFANAEGTQIAGDAVGEAGAAVPAVDGEAPESSSKQPWHVTAGQQMTVVGKGVARAWTALASTTATAIKMGSAAAAGSPAQPTTSAGGGPRTSQSGGEGGLELRVLSTDRDRELSDTPLSLRTHRSTGSYTGTLFEAIKIEEDYAQVPPDPEEVAAVTSPTGVEAEAAQPALGLEVPAAVVAPGDEEEDEVVEEVFENERFQPFRGWGHTWPGHFLPSDRVGHWSMRTGGPGGSASMVFDKVAPLPPKGWVWLDPEWSIDMTGAEQGCVDGDGWCYAVDYKWLRFPPGPGSGRLTIKSFVRRRRWVRVRVHDDACIELANLSPGGEGCSLHDAVPDEAGAGAWGGALHKASASLPVPGSCAGRSLEDCDAFSLASSASGMFRRPVTSRSMDDISRLGDLEAEPAELLAGSPQEYAASLQALKVLRRTRSMTEEISLTTSPRTCPSGISITLGSAPVSISPQGSGSLTFAPLASNSTPGADSPVMQRLASGGLSRSLSRQDSSGSSTAAVAASAAARIGSSSGGSHAAAPGTQVAGSAAPEKAAAAGTSSAASPAAKSTPRKKRAGRGGQQAAAVARPASSGGAPPASTLITQQGSAASVAGSAPAAAAAVAVASAGEGAPVTAISATEVSPASDAPQVSGGAAGATERVPPSKAATSNGVQRTDSKGGAQRQAPGAKKEGEGLETPAAAAAAQPVPPPSPTAAEPQRPAATHQSHSAPSTPQAAPPAPDTLGPEAHSAPREASSSSDGAADLLRQRRALSGEVKRSDSDSSALLRYVPRRTTSLEAVLSPPQQATRHPLLPDPQPDPDSGDDSPPASPKAQCTPPASASSQKPGSTTAAAAAPAHSSPASVQSSPATAAAPAHGGRTSVQPAPATSTAAMADAPQQPAGTTGADSPAPPESPALPAQAIPAGTAGSPEQPAKVAAETPGAPGAPSTPGQSTDTASAKPGLQKAVDHPAPAGQPSPGTAAATTPASPTGTAAPSKAAANPQAAPTRKPKAAAVAAAGGAPAAQSPAAVPSAPSALPGSSPGSADAAGSTPAATPPGAPAGTPAQSGSPKRTKAAAKGAAAPGTSPAATASAAVPSPPGKAASGASKGVEPSPAPVRDTTKSPLAKSASGASKEGAPSPSTPAPVSDTASSPPANSASGAAKGLSPRPTTAAPVSDTTSSPLTKSASGAAKGLPSPSTAAPVSGTARSKSATGATSPPQQQGPHHRSSKSQSAEAERAPPTPAAPTTPVIDAAASKAVLDSGPQDVASPALESGGKTDKQPAAAPMAGGAAGSSGPRSTEEEPATAVQLGSKPPSPRASDAGDAREAAAADGAGGEDQAASAHVRRWLDRLSTGIGQAKAQLSTGIAKTVAAATAAAAAAGTPAGEASPASTPKRGGSAPAATSTPTTPARKGGAPDDHATSKVAVPEAAHDSTASDGGGSTPKAGPKRDGAAGAAAEEPAVSLLEAVEAVMPGRTGSAESAGATPAALPGVLPGNTDSSPAHAAGSPAPTTPGAKPPRPTPTTASPPSEASPQHGRTPPTPPAHSTHRATPLGNILTSMRSSAPGAAKAPDTALPRISTSDPASGTGSPSAGTAAAAAAASSSAGSSPTVAGTADPASGQGDQMRRWLGRLSTNLTRSSTQLVAAMRRSDTGSLEEGAALPQLAGVHEDEVPAAPAAPPLPAVAAAAHPPAGPARTHEKNE